MHWDTKGKLGVLLGGRSPFRIISIKDKQKIIKKIVQAINSSYLLSWLAAAALFLLLLLLPADAAAAIASLLLLLLFFLW